MEQPSGVQVNLADYLKGKSAGTTKVVKIEGRTYYSQRRFSPDTGIPEPVLIVIDSESLKKSLSDMETTASALKALIADVEAAVDILAAA